MNHSIYYSKEKGCLIIIPNMGSGILITDREHSIMGTRPLNQFMSEDGTFKKVRGFQLK